MCFAVAPGNVFITYLALFRCLLNSAFLSILVHCPQKLPILPLGATASLYDFSQGTIQTLELSCLFVGGKMTWFCLMIGDFCWNIFDCCWVVDGSCRTIGDIWLFASGSCFVFDCSGVGDSFRVKNGCW